MSDEIINAWDQIRRAGGGVFIGYKADVGRGGTGRDWVVYRIGPDGKEIPTDTNGAWYQHGRKWFSVFGMGKREAFEAAKAWALEQFGEAGPWVRNRMHDYVPERINKQFPLRKREPRKP